MIFGAAAGLATGQLPAYTAPVAGPLYLTAAKADGSFKAMLLDKETETLWTLTLPGRGHGGAFNPVNTDCVIFSRRPGAFAVVVHRRSGQILHSLTPPDGRHFYGHGCYSADGRILYTTENDYDAEKGVIGLWNAANGYARIAEFDSYGIGPHDIALMPGGRFLAVANGGIATHPDTGRQKLNIPEMQPSLALVDANDGTRHTSLRLPSQLHKLSIRHLAVNNAGVIFAAMQYEGAADELPPLVARICDGRTHLLRAPGAIQSAMRNYCGSVAFGRSGGVIAVSCPRGGLVTFWNEDGTFAGSTAIKDGCGVAPATAAGEFILTGASGRIAVHSVKTGPAVGGKSVTGTMWDNHLVASKA